MCDPLLLQPPFTILALLPPPPVSSRLHHPSVPLPPPFQPFFFGLLPFNTRIATSESWLPRYTLEIRRSTNSSSTSSTSNSTPGCIYTYDRVVRERPAAPPPSVPLVARHDPYVWGWGAQATQMCWLYYQARALYKIALPSYCPQTEPDRQTVHGRTNEPIYRYWTPYHTTRHISRFSFVWTPTESFSPITSFLCQR